MQKQKHPVTIIFCFEGQITDNKDDDSYYYHE